MVNSTSKAKQQSILQGIFWALLLLQSVPVAKSGDELCVVGCTPYVDPFEPNNGIEKYKAMAREMAETCDIIVHVGDTKPGLKMGCNTTVMTLGVKLLADAGANILLYAPGDNEINDCHRMQSGPPEKRYPSEILKAADARQFLIDDLDLTNGMDVTGSVAVKNHDELSQTDNPSTCDDNGQNCTKYSCDFDKYIEMDHFAITTLEVIGSHWYLDDERLSGYPYQDFVDPLKDRLAMYVNAKDCALDWIDYAAEKAFQSGKRALFFLFHATFYAKYASVAMGAGSIGDYYKPDNLRNMTKQWGDQVGRPYLPLFEKLKEVSRKYNTLHFAVIHSDAHRWFQTRFDPFTHNYRNNIRSHHNMLIHQTEGASRALTMYTRVSVDAEKFQPITIKEEWSQAAYDAEPVGHAWTPYKP